MDFLSSNSLLLLEKSMGCLWTKQAAIQDNIANAETPGYKPKVVSFEAELRARLEGAGRSAAPLHCVREALAQVEAEVTELDGSARMDGNGVNITEQSVEAVRNAYQMQYVMSAIFSELQVLRTAIRGQ